MELFEMVFNENSIYETIFFNIKSVSAYKTVFDFKENDPVLFNQWKALAKSKYNISEANKEENEYMLMLQDEYENKAVFYPEFSKIVAITYAKVYSEDGKLKRIFQKITNDLEIDTIKNFHEVLSVISNDGVQSTPQYFPILCGHNIISNDIPLFVKRLLAHRNKFENKEKLLPYILKNHLNAKPWDSKIIDTINLWKFNGLGYTPLSIISDFMGLKKNTELLELDELSKYYWENFEKNPKDTLDFVGLQSATQTNLTIQLINELRIL